MNRIIGDIFIFVFGLMGYSVDANSSSSDASPHSLAELEGAWQGDLVVAGGKLRVVLNIVSDICLSHRWCIWCVSTIRRMAVGFDISSNREVRPEYNGTNWD